MTMLLRGPRPQEEMSPQPAEGTAPWAVLCPRGTVTVPGGRRARSALAALPSGSHVAVVSDRPGSRRSLRHLCEASGVRVDRELVALPSARRPLVLLDDDPLSVGRFWTAVAVIPPAPGWVTAPATVVLAVAARLPWRWTGALAPGRVLIGVRR